MLRLKTSGFKLRSIISTKIVTFHNSNIRGISNSSDLTQLHASVPTKKTTVILRKVPSSVSQSTLREALETVSNCRKVELEPGCVLHFSNEVAAERTISQIKGNFQCDVIFAVFIVI